MITSINETQEIIKLRKELNYLELENKKHREVISSLREHIIGLYRRIDWLFNNKKDGSNIINGDLYCLPDSTEELFSSDL